MTVATGFMSEIQETRTGLVATHAYAVLDVRKVQVLNNFSLLLDLFLAEILGFRLDINVRISSFTREVHTCTQMAV